MRAPRCEASQRGAERGRSSQKRRRGFSRAARLVSRRRWPSRAPSARATTCRTSAWSAARPAPSPPCWPRSAATASGAGTPRRYAAAPAAPPCRPRTLRGRHGDLGVKGSSSSPAIPRGPGRGGPSSVKCAGNAWWPWRLGDGLPRGKGRGCGLGALSARGGAPRGVLEQPTPFKVRSWDLQKRNGAFSFRAIKNHRDVKDFVTCPEVRGHSTQSWEATHETAFASHLCISHR